MAAEGTEATSGVVAAGNDGVPSNSIVTLGGTPMVPCNTAAAAVVGEAADGVAVGFVLQQEVVSRC